MESVIGSVGERDLLLFLYVLKTPCYAGGSGKLLAMDKKKTPVVQ